MYKMRRLPMTVTCEVTEKGLVIYAHDHFYESHDVVVRFMHRLVGTKIFVKGQIKCVLIATFQRKKEKKKKCIRPSYNNVVKMESRCLRYVYD